MRPQGGVKREAETPSPSWECAARFVEQHFAAWDLRPATIPPSMTPAILCCCPPTRLPGLAAHRWAGALHRLEGPQPHVLAAAAPGQGRFSPSSCALQARPQARPSVILLCYHSILAAIVCFTNLSCRCVRRGWLWRTATCPSATCCGSRAAGGRLVVSWHALLESKERAQEREERTEARLGGGKESGVPFHSWVASTCCALHSTTLRRRSPGSEYVLDLIVQRAVTVVLFLPFHHSLPMHQLAGATRGASTCWTSLWSTLCLFCSCLSITRYPCTDMQVQPRQRICAGLHCVALKKSSVLPSHCPLPMHHHAGAPQGTSTCWTLSWSASRCRTWWGPSRAAPASSAKRWVP